MTVIESIEKICRGLETEFENDAVLLFYEYAPDIRLLSVGINHPLWDSYPIEHVILPSHCSIEPTLKILEDALRKDIEGIDKVIRENY
jgi:hypothetical protein